MTTSLIPDAAVSPLRQRLIADMSMRRLSAEAQCNYLPEVGRLASFLARSPDTASVEDLRRVQIALQEAGLGVPTMNAVLSALWQRSASERWQEWRSRSSTPASILAANRPIR